MRLVIRFDVYFRYAHQTLMRKVVIIFHDFYRIIQFSRIMLIKIQPDATVCRYLFTAKSLYIFRVSHHPSSGVLKTVTAASGTGHNTGIATSLQRGLIGTGLCESHKPVRILCQWKIPMTPARIQPATFRFVAQHLLCYRGPHSKLLLS